MTTPHEINAEVRRWVEKAENDFRNSEYVLTLKENCPFPKENRLKDVRVEALLTGFKHCWTNKILSPFYSCRFRIIPMKRYCVMNTKELLINEIDEAPEPLLIEVLDFVHFLKAKRVREKLDIAIMSKSSLSKDWLKPEEEEAWKNL
jgi:hypothetical protein